MSSDRALHLDVRSGAERARLKLTVDNPETFYRWLLGTRASQEEDQLSQSAAEDLDISPEDASELVTLLHGESVLVEPEQNDRFFELVRGWSEMGWRDAADFHVASYGLPFLPDDDGGQTYRELFRDLLESPGVIGDQPEHYAPKATRRALALAIERLPDGVSAQDVLESARPVNKFSGPAPDAAALMAGLVDACAAQRVVGGSLGEHQQRAYPSGGSRHPFEAYLVSKGIDGIPQGTYWFDPLTHELHPRETVASDEEVNAACFGKGGVVSSRVCVVLTCRWLRHSWKYRYARSYRMLLLELGHMIQAINLSMRARGVDVYQCPSIHDSEWLRLLDLDDDGQEGPMYVLGLGTKGRI